MLERTLQLVVFYCAFESKNILQVMDLFNNELSIIFVRMNKTESFASILTYNIYMKSKRSILLRYKLILMLGNNLFINSQQQWDWLGCKLNCLRN